MRVDETIERVGHFWIPGKEDSKSSGTLKISDGGKVTLNLIGSFGDGLIDFLRDFNKSNSSGIDHERIVGIVENYGYVTLDGCFYKKRNISIGPNITKSEIFVNFAILGIAYGHDEPIIMTEFSFSIEHLEDWLQMRCFETSFFENNNVSIIYNLSDHITIELDNDLTIEFRFQYSMPGSNFREAKISQKAYIKIISQSAIEIEKFIGLSQKIANLLCLSASDTLSILSVQCASEEHTETFGEKKLLKKFDVFYGARPFSKNKPEIFPHSFLFSFPDIADNAKEVINNWINIHNQLSPAIGLYFSAKSGSHQSLEGHFLALTQAAETLHRRTSTETTMTEDEFDRIISSIEISTDPEFLDFIKSRLTHGNELPLRKRINRLLRDLSNVFGNSKEREKIANNVTDLRNYLTHYDEKKSSEKYDGRYMWRLSKKLEVLLQLHFMKSIGLSTERIKIIVDNSSHIQQIIN